MMQMCINNEKKTLVEQKLCVDDNFLPTQSRLSPTAAIPRPKFVFSEKWRKKHLFILLWLIIQYLCWRFTNYKIILPFEYLLHWWGNDWALFPNKPTFYKPWHIPPIWHKLILISLLDIYAHNKNLRCAG